MKNPRLIIVASLVLTFGLSGCSTPRGASRSGSRDFAYIIYWPPSDSSRTRVAVKDLIDMKGVVTTAGSEFLSKTSPPARRDAACLRGVRAGNIQIVGKTNLSELAVGVSGINDYFGTPKNLLSPRRHLIPGGSSSGSAVAVMNGTADIAIGTDTAGSIRVPAACCGIVGLKTTFGLVPLDGVYPIAPNHLDTVGPMAKDVAHTAQGMAMLQGGFAAQYRSATAAKPSAQMIKVGRLHVGGTSAKVDRAVDDALARTGFRVIALDESFQEKWKQADSDAKTVAAASAWLSDDKYSGQAGVSIRTKAVVALGAFQYHTNYRAALQRQAAWQATLRRVFKKVDFIALPTLQTLPPRIPFFGGNPAFEALVLGAQNTAAVNFAGNPAMAIPIPVADRSVAVSSLQLIGPPRSEAGLLNAGRLVESARPMVSP